MITWKTLQLNLLLIIAVVGTITSCAPPRKGFNETVRSEESSLSTDLPGTGTIVEVPEPIIPLNLDSVNHGIGQAE